MLTNFGFSEWVIVFLVMVAISGVVSVMGVEHDDDNDDMNLRKTAY
mgnify:CR=1 FL=1